MKDAVWIYLLVMNAAGFFLMQIDKYKAKRHLWRIPEKTLFLAAALGGSVGSMLGMHLFHHKTKKKAFVVGMPMILLLQVTIFLVVIYN